MRNPWLAAALAIAAPLVAIFIGLQLLDALRLDSGSAAYSASSRAVIGKAIAQILDRDLATDRIQEILSRLPDPKPGKDDKGKAARTTARAGYLKTIAGRLNADRSRLADDLTALAMGPTRSEHVAVLTGGPQAVANVKKRFARVHQCPDLTKSTVD